MDKISVSALLLGSLVSFILGLLAKVLYDFITRRKRRLQAAQSFISKIDLLMSSVKYFESYYYDEFKFLDKVRVTFPIDYVIDKIEPQDSFGLDSPNTDELSLLYHGSQYYLVSLSSTLQKRNVAIIEANKVLEILFKVSKERKPAIKRELRQLIYNLRTEQESILTIGACAKEFMLNFDLVYFDWLYYYNKWDSIGEMFRLYDEPILEYSHFKKGQSDFLIPRSFSDLRRRHFIYRIKTAIRNLFPL